MIISTQTCQNALLKSLPESDLAKIASHCKLVKLDVGQVVFETGLEVHSIHFPIDSIISLMHESFDGKSSEVASISSEGAIGINNVLNNNLPTFRAMTTHSGFAYVMNKADVLVEFQKVISFQNQLLNCIHQLTIQISLNGICGRFHSVKQQFCKFLLQYDDRFSNQISLTHEAIATRIGVRRESITEAAHALQKKGIIDYARGQITILDRPALEELSCECYHSQKMIRHGKSKLVA